MVKHEYHKEQKYSFKLKELFKFENFPLKNRVIVIDITGIHSWDF